MNGVALIVTAAAALGGGEKPKCYTAVCERRVKHRQVLRLHIEAKRDHPWKHAYFHLPQAMKDKLRRVRRCESTNRPGAVSPGGRYRGYYQYDMPTAREAGFTADPASLVSSEGRYQQHVRTARFALRVGWGRWPICGRL